MMNPFRKLWQNWKGTRGIEPTPTIVTESRRSYLWLCFILFMDIPIVMCLIFYAPIEGMEWFWYPVFCWLIWNHSYHPVKIIKDLLEKKTRTLVEGPLDRVTMADPEVKGTIDIGVECFKEIGTDNPMSFMVKLDVYQRGGIEEFAIKGDPEDGAVIAPRGSLLNFGHTRVLNAYPHRYLVRDLSEPIRSQLKNKLPYEDHHFVDLATEQMYITIKPEQTGEAIGMMEDTWQLMAKVYNYLEKNDGGEKGMLEVVDAMRDNMYNLREIFQNVEAGKLKFNMDHMVKEQQRDIEKLKAEKNEINEQLRQWRQGRQPPEPPQGETR